MAAAFINIRIGRLPGRIQEIALNGDRTVATALATAGLDAAGFEIRVQGQPATPATTLAEGDLVLLVKKIKGNADFIVVRVGRVPGPPLTEVAVADQTVRAAIQAADLALALPGEVVFVNDSLAELATRVADGDTVVIKAVSMIPPSESEEDDEEYETSLPEAEVDAADLDWAESQASTLRQQGEAQIALATRAEAAIAAYQAARENLDSAKAELKAILGELE